MLNDNMLSENGLTDNSLNDAGNNGHGMTLAAIDLGSNSFHMVVARVDHNEMRPIEGFAERVQLASDMEKNHLSLDAIARGLACLSRFRQVLDTLKPDMVRVVGTNALRAAKNAGEFIHPAELLIGHPVEVISGREEARLVYLGVAHTLADDDAARLVIDIGGGSTEFVIGHRFEPMLRESLHMGCVTFADRFFPRGKITKKSFDRAYQSAYQEVLNIRKSYKKHGWENAVGSSGTMRTVEQVICAQGWGTEGITTSGLCKLRDMLLQSHHMEELTELDGLSERRRHVIVPGVAIICGVFDALGIEHIQTSPGALREGVVYDMVGRLAHEDVRERTVSAMMKRSDVDQQNADQVEHIAMLLFDAASGDWGLDGGDRDLLSWAARLHEIGLSVAHTQFHKHGQYLIEHSDLSGFSKQEQQFLGLLVRSHRQKFPTGDFAQYGSRRAIRLLRLCVLIRLAALFKYVSLVEDIPPFITHVKDDEVTLFFTRGWLARNPLTSAALRSEQHQLKKVGFRLKLAER
ncbi:MAG: Ppx/GppA phosphatase family protein [Porticoccus sp.]|nr:Ppx/GppA phosphatase family protein [Porticoccus sp.]